MIREIFENSFIESERLIKSYYGRKILAYFNAYGIKYNFCRFFELKYENISGIMLEINSTVVIWNETDMPQEAINEIAEYVKMVQPIRVEAPWYIMKHLGDIEGYIPLTRTLFKYKGMETESKVKETDVTVPKLDTIYPILSESFPKTQDYGLWITDMSHRIRRDITKVWLYKDCTTLTEIYDIDDHILIGQVATRRDSRGKGYARNLLSFICEKRKAEGKTLWLFALDHRVSFYKGIGFEAISHENVIQRSDSLIEHEKR